MPAVHSTPAGVTGWEDFGVLKLPLGGPNGYWQVCKSGDKFQGKDRVRGIYTKLYGTAHEAAVALAQKKFDQEAGLETSQPRKKRTKAASGNPSSPFSPRAYPLTEWLFPPQVWNRRSRS